MKVRTDIVTMYKEVHGWVGIVSGLALFIAFYAGAITMFEGPLQRWASPPTSLAPAPSLERTPELIRAVIAAHPEAAHDLDVHLEIGPDRPARVSWEVHEGDGDDHGLIPTRYASFAADGSLQVEEVGPSPVGQFVDTLHQQVGLPLPAEIALPIMGAICLLYVIAIISGIIVLLPSLVSDLFALRVGKNVKRMWLDVHNVLGVLSVPFHLVMAFTAIVFAFHDNFYDAQQATFSRAPPTRPAASAPPPPAAMMPPTEVVRRIDAQAPGFNPTTISYGEGPNGRPFLRVAGTDDRYGLRAATYGFAGLNPATGELVMRDYMPGHQDGWGATISSFFALHFGNFGGPGIRWTYFFLGLAGAFLFYTGNLLWVESRRKKERRRGPVEQSRSTRILGALTVGVPLGCIAGIAVTLAAAKPFGLAATSGLHGWVYYAVFLGFTFWALWRGASRAGIELIPFTAAALLLVPLATLATLGGHPPVEPLVDIVSVLGAVSLMIGWRLARKRALDGPRDSVWSLPKAKPVPAE